MLPRVWILEGTSVVGVVYSQGTIRQCKLLTSLRITFDFAGEGGPPADASSLIMDLVAALPNLATLHWEEEPSTKSQPRHKQAFPVYTGEKAAESLAGSRLRLMQAEHCTFDAVAALPASLRIFSLWNGMGHHHKNYNRLDMLLAPCTALRELYILQCTLCRPASLDLSLIAACCPALRVVVLHVLREVGQEVSVHLHSSMHWPGSLVVALYACHCASDILPMYVRRLFHSATGTVSCPTLRSC